MKTLLTSFLALLHLSVAPPPLVDNFLGTLYGSMELSVGQYKGAKLEVEKSLKSGSLKTQNSQWTCDVAVSKTSDVGALDVSPTIKLKKGEAKEVAPSAVFRFGKWSTKNYVLIPASVYNGNRYRILGNGYSPAYTKDVYYNPNVPLTISNNPHLSADPSAPSFLEVQTTNAATPSVCFFSPELNRGFILLTRQNTVFGNSGISVSEDIKKREACIKITAPAMREKSCGFGDFFPSGDTAPSWKEGDKVTLDFRLFSFEAKRIPDVLKKFFEVRKSLSGENDPRNLVPMSKLREWATGICRNNWITVPAGSYYTPENNKDFQLGWVSGMMNTYPMLALNDEKERGRTAKEIDFVVEKLQGKSGYFFGGITAEGKIRPEKMIADFPQVQAMVRKNCDVLFWFIKHFMLLKEQGHETIIDKKWEAAAHRLATAFVKSWKEHGQFGQYIVPDTGEIAVFNSTAGAIAPAGLALASAYFRDDSFLQTAIASANYYYERDVVKQGLTGGHCGDISQDADSESCFGFLESLMALYSITGDKSWLDKAAVQAALCSTWAVSYDAAFPPQSDIGKLGCHMAGAVWASIQNKNAAPGICTASGEYLFKLYCAPGNKLYADLIRDIQHAHSEAVDLPNHRTTHMGFGTSMERIQLSDAEGKGSIGNFIRTRNSWTETDGMLMTLELPGIYWQTDKDLIYVFDHVEAKLTKENNQTKIQIRNPTPFDAVVSIFSETSAEAKKLLSYVAFHHWPTVKAEAGKTVTYTVK